MSERLFRIGTDTKTYTADDMTGTGAKLSGGRWNDIGVAIVYASPTRALACLETFVHLNAGGLPLNRYLVEVEVPDDLWTSAESVTPSSLAVGWDAEPAGLVSTEFGSLWANSSRSALLKVPSVIIPEEQNVLINPIHSDTRRIMARKVRKWIYDPRMDRRI